jgi:hypothetical protein
MAAFNKQVPLLLLSLTLSSPPEAATIEFHPHRGGGWIEVTGEIESGDKDLILDLLRRENWTPTTIYLNSPGGNALEGLQIGLLVDILGLTTVVGSRTCTSACALAWLGGQKRLLMPDSMVGFHSAYTIESDGELRRSEIGNAAIALYGAILGMDASAIDFLTAADPEDIFWITPLIASRLGIDVYWLDASRDVIPYSHHNNSIQLR